MKLGIISDTHDHLKNIKKAIGVFNNEKVDLVIHCGDFVSLFVIKEFKKLNSKIISVYGNNDGEKVLLKEWLKEIDQDNELENYLSFEIDSLRFFVLHGTHGPILESVIKSKEYDVVIHGHTHESFFDEVNGILVINPGECCGYLTGKSSIGILNTVSKEYQEIDLDEVSEI
ncbi:phosphodiesterase, MJ0936 family [Methanococcus vannielii SB]|uniref:Phosphoesterase n=1 Tax=Methanococcus vannielii (strain ATCC 35089 / DSM 1224 / JCM 13029 / OCM 148 / SB) TaxID=406327 RepID=A6US05_METVS|nr:metallophosphoesterase [Methanococcus vannielii]ABR55277.1 phosphodiesterase, MJ0936 family [Methanococcus vannielii SB]